MPVLSVMAQQKYSLTAFVDSSIKYLPTLKQKTALINMAKASVNDVKHSFLPQLKFSEQLNIASNNSMATTFFSFGITPTTSGGIRSNNSLDAVTANVGVLYSEYELANFGLNNAKLNYTNANVNLQEADLQKEQYLVSLEVARLYFNIL